MPVKIKQGSKYIYTFQSGNAEGNSDMRDLLGGKGANLAEMCNLGLPVPSGLTITTEACKKYRELTDQEEKDSFLKRLANRAYALLNKMNDQTYMPLVSVRSGAKISMAGMMDTILNVGHSVGRFSELFPVLGARTTLDSYRRLQQMYGSTVLGIDEHYFEDGIKTVKEHYNVELDTELTEDALMTLIKAFDSTYKLLEHDKVPLSYEEQLVACIRAVFDSWDNERAKIYRKHHGIPEDLGTAVNIQFMVFGNAEGLSGSGVMFTRNTSTGENKPQGEFLLDAQGEDVVAGVRTPEPLDLLAKKAATQHKQLLNLASKLEDHYNDVQDIEFTIQNGELFLLQTRHAKRTAVAEIKIASDFIKEERWDLLDLQDKVKAQSFELLAKPKLKPEAGNIVLAKGLGTGGVASGMVATCKADALAMHADGKEFVLWAKETTPNDLEAMLVAKAIVTETGGQTCHAAVVARSLNLPCVVGTGTPWDGAQLVTVDADNGDVYSGLVPVEAMEEPAYARELVSYIAQSAGLIQSGDVVDGTQYVMVTKEKSLSADIGELVLDLTELEQELSKADYELLTLTGRNADGYRNELFKARLEGTPFGWLNLANKAGAMPSTRLAVSDKPMQLAPLIKLVMNTLNFKFVEAITCPDDLISGGVGTVDEKKLTDLLGGELFNYIKEKAEADGLYPKDVKRVSSRAEILNTLKGD